MEIATGTTLKTMDGKLATVIKTDDKCGTATIKFEDGSAKTYTFGTLKDRERFLPADEDSDDEYVKEVMQQKKDLGIECPKIESYEVVVDHELIPMPGIEKLEELKKEYPGKKQETLCEGTGVDVKDFIVETAVSLGAEVCEASTGKFISFKIDGKMFAAIFSFSKKSTTLGARSAAVGHLTPTKTIAHMMDFRFTFDSLSDDNKDMITKILEASKDYQLNKNNK